MDEVFGDENFIALIVVQKLAAFHGRNTRQCVDYRSLVRKANAESNSRRSIHQKSRGRGRLMYWLDDFRTDRIERLT